MATFTSFNFRNPLASMFDWAGGRYPFAGSYVGNYGNGTSIIDTSNYPTNFIKYKTLTLQAGATLRILRSPFFIFADEIIGGSGCVIDATGPDGASSGVFTCEQAWGGTQVHGSGRAQGGCGGGFLIIVCNKFNGLPVTIKANGGTGWVNLGKSSNSYVRSTGGQGALSTLKDNEGNSQLWDGLPPATLVHPLGLLLGKGGGTGGAGGGSSGGGSSYYTGGGSGIGGGGGTANGASPPATTAEIMPQQALILASSYRCRGGGGGGAKIVASTASDGKANIAGGGGGGCIIVFVNDATSVVPTLQVNGGITVGGGIKGTDWSGVDGAAGLTFYINLDL